MKYLFLNLKQFMINASIISILQMSSDYNRIVRKDIFIGRFHIVKFDVFTMTLTSQTTCQINFVGRQLGDCYTQNRLPNGNFGRIGDWATGRQLIFFTVYVIGICR